MSNIFTNPKKIPKSALLMAVSFLGGTIVGGLVMLIILVMIGLSSYR